MNLWDVKGVPHNGWKCEGVIDVGDGTSSSDEIEYEQCEMCGNEKIRYVHIMKHANYFRELRVGCVCAERMSGDYENPRKAENALKNKLLRKKNFLKKPWKYNPLKGSYSKKYKGTYIALVKGRYDSWGIYCDKYRLWQVRGQKIKDFKAAEALAFELYELCYRRQETMAA